MKRRAFAATGLIAACLSVFTKPSEASVENAMLYDQNDVPIPNGPHAICIEKGKVTLANGNEVTTYATFNNGFSHIISEDNCWIIVNGYEGMAKPSTHIFPEAAVALKHLPANPRDHIET